MRDSINYNLKYFIMKMSGTKPMKNTMRKPSPLKFDSVIATSLATKEGKASYEASRPKGTTKPVEGKPKLTKDNTVKTGSMIRVSKEKAAEVAAKKAKGTTKPVEGKPSSKPTTQGGFRGVLEKAKAKAQANKSETTKTETAAPKKAGSWRDAAKALKARSEAKKATATTKAPEGKPKIAVKKAAPTMQLKKAGMKKKC
jgi:hypothetical protein